MKCKREDRLRGMCVYACVIMQDEYCQSLGG